MAKAKLEETFPLYLRNVIKKLGFSVTSQEALRYRLLDVQGPFELYWQMPKESWDWERDLGVLSPLFNSMWMEGQADIPVGRILQGLPENHIRQVEEQRRTERGGRSADAPKRVAAKITTHEPDKFYKFKYKIDNEYTEWKKEARWVHVIEGYSETSPGFSVKLPEIHVRVDEHGRYAGHAQFDLIGRDDLIPSKLIAFAEDLAFSALYALSLANCKNVRVTEGVTAIHSKAVAKRVGEGAPGDVVFSTIDLAKVGASPEADDDPRLRKNQRLHVVRGHFKTYTEDKKLLGQITGTYFWHPHARGNSSKGEVISDYKI